MYNIIIMDRQRSNRQKIRHYMDDFSAEFKIIGDVSTGDQAARYLDTQHVDLIIGDDSLIGKTGLQLFNDYRDLLPGLHMILFTDARMFSQSKETLANGRLDYLYKPVRKADVLESLRHMATLIDGAQQRSLDAKKLRYNYEENQVQFKERFLMNLIYGSIRRNALIYDQLDYFKIRYTDFFAVATFKIDDYRRYQLALDEDEIQFLIFQVYSLISQDMETNQSGIAFISRYDEVTMIFTHIREQMDIIDYCNVLHKLIHDTLEIPGTIGVGQGYAEPKHIHLSYNQAIDAVLEHDYLGKDTVIHTHYVTGKKDLTYAFGPEQEDMIIKYALSGQLLDCLKTTKKVLASIEELGQFNSDFYIAFIRKLLYHLYRDGLAHDYHFEEHITQNMATIKSEDVFDTDNTFAYLQEALTLVTDYVAEQKLDQDQLLLENALKYVQAYYTSRISLTSAAQYLMTTPKHLEDIIYRVYEKSFYDFCIMVRVENAKEMLLNTKLTTTEVANAVGFNNTEYFVAIFKQHTNVTPSEYRHQNNDTSDLPITLNKQATINRINRRYI